MSTPGSLAGGSQEAGWGRPGQDRPQGYPGGPRSGPEEPRFPHRWGPVGRVRSNGVALLLFVVTFGVYGLFYTYFVHDEMKRHSWEGIGGAIGVVVAMFAGVASPFLLSSEVGGLYERMGRAKAVSGSTGLWSLTPYVMIFALIFCLFAGMRPTSAVIPAGAMLLSLAGPFVWFIRTNSALNDYWRSFGAR